VSGEHDATAAAVDMPISISGLAGQDVTLVFTNQSGTRRCRRSRSPLHLRPWPSAIQWDDGVNAVQRRIADFNRDGWAALAGTAGTAPSQSSFGATPPCVPPTPWAMLAPGITRTTRA
jgi:hypothetical protein